MGMRRCKIAFVLCMLGLASPVAAQVPELSPLNYKLRYDVRWNGIPLGRIRIEAAEDRFGYRMTLDTKTRGIVRLFDPQRGLVNVRGRMQEGRYLPQWYASRALDDENGRHTQIHYESDGTIKTRERTPPDDPRNRPPVPLAQANTATDPLTAMFILRHELRDNMAANRRDTAVRTYDGARLAEFNFHVVSRAQLKIMGAHHDAINSVMTRSLIAGYKDKEIRRYEEGDPVVHVYFSADARLLPLRAEINLRLGNITADLTEME